MTGETQGLKHVSPSPLTRRLLESAKTDASAPGAMQRALSGFGLASGAVVAAKVAAAGAQSGASALGASTGTAAAAKAGVATVMVWVGVGFAGSVALVGGAAMLSGGAESPISAPATSVVAAPAPALSREVTAVATRAAPASPVVSAQPASAPTPGAPGVVVNPQLETEETELEVTLPSARAFEGPAAASSSSLAQLAQLASIRKALAAKQPALALTQLDQFARQYPASPLAEEALVLRIEALHALGRSGAAAALAKDFLASHPTSVYEARVRATIP